MIRKMNKKGASLSGWLEGAIGIMLIMACIGIIIIGMNNDYGENYDPTFGLSSESTRESFSEYQDQLQQGLSGDASTNSVTGGVNLLSAWGMAKAGFNLVIDFITGVWITNGIALLQLGEAGIWLGWALRLLFIFSLIFTLIVLIFKVKI